MMPMFVEHVACLVWTILHDVSRCIIHTVSLSYALPDPIPTVAASVRICVRTCSYSACSNVKFGTFWKVREFVCVCVSREIAIPFNLRFCSYGLLHFRIPVASSLASFSFLLSPNRRTGFLIA